MFRMTRVPEWMGLGLLLTMVLCESVGAQNIGMCFRGQPLPACQTFWLTEFGYYRTIHSTDFPPRTQNDWYLSGEIGFMANMNQRYAIGLSGVFGGVNSGSRFGIKPRFRMWLRNRVSVDVAPGILLSGGDNRYEPQFPGFTGHIAVNFADLGALTLHLDVIPYEKSRRVGPGQGVLVETGNDVSLYGGVKFGSYLGILGGFVALILYGIALSQIQFD